MMSKEQWEAKMKEDGLNLDQPHLVVHAHAYRDTFSHTPITHPPHTHHKLSLYTSLITLITLLTPLTLQTTQYETAEAVAGREKKEKKKEEEPVVRMERVQPRRIV